MIRCLARQAPPRAGLSIVCASGRPNCGCCSEYRTLIPIGRARSAELGQGTELIRSIPIYFLIGGVIWLCFDVSGIHATIAGVVLGLMTPTRVWVSDARLRAVLGRLLSYPGGEHWSGNTADRRDLRRAGVAVTESLSPVERLEMMLHPWVGFAIMPIFALANAGVAISGADIGQPVQVAIFAGLVIGKPIGVLAFSWLAARLGLAARPAGLSWRLLAAGGFLTGIGFTMSLFNRRTCLRPGHAGPGENRDSGRVGRLGCGRPSDADIAYLRTQDRVMARYSRASDLT